jgi:hypothetical protein
MGASLVVEGSTNGTVFETYLEDVLLPTLKRGQVVVMDNLLLISAQISKPQILLALCNRG